MPGEDQREPAEVAEDKKPTEDVKPASDGEQVDEEGEDKPESKTEGKDSKTKTISVKEYNKLKAVERKAKKKIESESSEEDSDGRFSHEEPEEDDEPTESEVARQDREEFQTVVVGVVQLQIDNDDVRNLVKGDKSLARILKKNPLMLLDETPIDGEDALEQITEYLTARAEEEKDDDDDDDNGSDGGKKKPAKPAPQKPKVEEKKEEKKDPFNANTSQKKVEGSILDRLS